MSLLIAVPLMAAGATVQRVGLVLRFNNDDTTVRTMWSESPSTVADVANPPNGDRSPMYRPQSDLLPLGPRRSVPPSNDIAGFHAEELLISAWTAILRDAGILEGNLRNVDLVLSKSPCHGPSGSSPLSLTLGGQLFPQGCAGKLAEFVKTKPRIIRWRVFFLSLAGSHATSYQQRGYGFRRLMNEEELELARAARAHVFQRDVLDPIQARTAQNWRDASMFAQQRGALIRDSPFLKKTHGKDIGPAFSASKKYGQLSHGVEREREERARELWEQARFSSVRQAQSGISVLETVFNIDCRRWLNDV